jgi:hypothetical protein
MKPIIDRPMSRNHETDPRSANRSGINKPILGRRFDPESMKPILGRAIDPESMKPSRDRKGAVSGE